MEYILELWVLNIWKQVGRMECEVDRQRKMKVVMVYAWDPDPGKSVEAEGGR